MLIGQRIKKRRIELGMTTEELAQKIGRKRNSLYRYENGLNENISTKVLEALIIALDTTKEYLYGLTDDADKKNEVETSLLLETEYSERAYLLDRFDGMSQIGKSKLIEIAEDIYFAEQYKIIQELPEHEIQDLIGEPIE